MTNCTPCGRPQPHTALARRLARWSCLLLIGTLGLASCKPLPPPPATPPKAAPPPVKAKRPPPVEPDTPSEVCAARDKVLGEKYAPYLDAFSNRGLAFSPDGASLLFASDRGGGPSQLYLVSTAGRGAEPVALAPGDAPVSEAGFSPDGLSVFFLRPDPKSGNDQLYRASIDGAAVTPLGEDPGLRHSLPRVAPDWKTIIYLRNNPTTGEVQLVSQSLAGGPAKVLWQRRGSFVLTDIGPEGKQVLLSQLAGFSRSRVWLLNLETGKAVKVAPSEGSNQAHSAQFAEDGQSIFLLTTIDGRMGIQKLELATKKPLATFSDRQGQVTALVVSRQAPVVAATVQQGNSSTLRLLDLTRLRDKARPRLLGGSVQLAGFSPDGQGLVVTFSTPDQPDDVYWVSTTNGRQRPLLRERRPTLRALGRLRVQNVSIPSAEGVTLPTTLTLPQRLPRGKKLPVIVHLIDGPATAALLRWQPEVRFWIDQGFAVLEPNLRGASGFGPDFEAADNGDKRLDVLKDLEAVQQWTAKATFADPQRLALVGSGYGAYLVYLAAGHQSELWQVGLGQAGPVDLRTFLRGTRSPQQGVLVAEMGLPGKQDPLLKSLSPIAVIDQIRTPLFVFQGHRDRVVLRREQGQLIRELRARQRPVEYMVAQEAGHDFASRETRLEQMGRSLRFLEQHLDLPSVPAGCPPAGKETAAPAVPQEPAGTAAPAAKD